MTEDNRGRGAAALSTSESTNKEDEEIGDAIDVSEGSHETAATMTHLHTLASREPGQSKVELLAAKIEKRREGRIPVTFPVRVEFLQTCRNIAVAKGYEKKTRIHYFDLLEYRRRIRDEVGNRYKPYKKLSRLEAYWRIINDRHCLLDVLNRAVEIVDKIQHEEDEWFHYQDFNFFHTFLVSRWPWKRHGVLSAAFTIMAFYAFTPILFCTIMQDRDICGPGDDSVANMIRNALYFSSTTLSTVGYGDLTVEKDEPVKVLVGLLYMVIAMYVAFTAFSAAAASAFMPIKSAFNRCLRGYPTGPFKEGEYLYQRVRKIKRIKYTEIVTSFITMNLVFVFAVRLSQGGKGLDWMDSLYIAVQTTTTIGYGDYDIPDDLRWFQIIYLTIGTYLTGRALGKLGSLHSDLEQVRKYHAFQRRNVNKHMIHYLASTDDPDRVDQYEFVIASLLDLGKITREDIGPIMDKYRSLERSAGLSGYIEVSTAPDESEMELDNLENTEGADGT